MLDFFREVSGNEHDILDIITEHHKPLKDLIRVMKNEISSITEIKSAVKRFTPLLLNHARAEQSVLYKAMKEHKNLIRVEAFEGEAEHGIAEELVLRLRRLSDKDHYRAEVKVLAESVEHHLKEEEKIIFPNVRNQIESKERIELGERYLELYQQLENRRAAA